MKLFELVPDKFYSILTGKNKNIYVVALLTLYSLINSNDFNVKKEEFIRFLKEKADNDIKDFSIEEETEFSDFDDSTSISSKASLIVKRLEETGWIEIELDPNSFDEYIVLPTYSIKSISTLFDIVNESSEAYSSLVHTTYSELKLEDDNHDEFMYATLVKAYENTKKLKVDLITLSHSIRIYQNRLNKLFTSNEVLHSYFDNYKELVSDRLYHPLKTFDSVARFKRPIVTILEKWLSDTETRNYLIKQGLIFSKNSNSPEEVEKEIIEKINYICDMYEAIDSIIDQIDVKHRDYTKATANKVLFFTNTDKSVRANIETILIGFAQNKSNPKVMKNLLSLMQDSTSLCQSGFISPDSLTLPIYHKYLDEQAPLQIMSGNSVDDYMMAKFLDEVNGMFTDEKIYEFMYHAFGEKDKIKSSEIPLPNDDAFILLILATIRNDDSHCFYKVDFGSKNKIVSHGYIIPELTFTLKNINELGVN